MLITSDPRGQKDPRTAPVIACAIEVHQALGPGLLEQPYHAAMCIALAERQLTFEREREYPALFKGIVVGKYRPDLIVNNEVVVEIKSAERFDQVFIAQMLTYLRITGCKVGLIINFNRPRLVDGVRRVLLFDAQASPELVDCALQSGEAITPAGGSSQPGDDGSRSRIDGAKG